MITREKFESLTPYQRGYVVYMAGERDDQPNVPNEKNPYPKDTEARRQWDAGQEAACRDAQDGEE